MADKITVTWLGHSCFKAEAGGYSIVLDPYGDESVPGLPALRDSANQVLASHGHRDHGFVEGIAVNEFSGSSPWNISWVDTYHDDKQGALRGENRIHILEYKGIRLVHLGDLGCDLTSEQVSAIGKPDVLLIPVGGFYTIDAVQAKAVSGQLGAVVTVPMHYRSDRFGYDVIGTLDQYTCLCDDVKVYPGNTLEIVKGMNPQTAVLTLELD